MNEVQVPIDWGFNLAVVLIGLLVVFVVLLILVLLCTLTGRIFANIDKNKKAKLDGTNIKADRKEPATGTKPIVTKVATAVAPVVESGITEDAVAAITAALACIMGSEHPFAVKSIKRVRGSRPAWNAAGITENTRPF